MLGIYACAVLSSKGYTVQCTDVSDVRLSLVAEFGGNPVKGLSRSVLIVI